MERNRYERVDYSNAKKFLKDSPKTKFKKNLLEEISERYKTPNAGYKRKLNKFDEIVELAYNLAIQRRDRPNAIKELAGELVREYYFYRNSFLKSYMSAEFNKKWSKYSIKRQFEEARRMAILDRFKNFRSAYGSERIKININGEEKEISIRTLFTMYKKGQISRSELFKKVQYFHDTVLTKYNTKEYRQRDGNADISRYANR